jgi:hypothetical protein
MHRFTISHHTGSKEGDHYDLMLEQGDTLKTWRLSNTAFLVSQVARQIKDHRKTYLDYEGEISGDRGRVKIWDTGTYSVDEWKEDRIQVALVGRSLKTRLILTLGPKHPEDTDPRWNIRRRDPGAAQGGDRPAPRRVARRRPQRRAERPARGPLPRGAQDPLARRPVHPRRRDRLVAHRPRLRHAQADRQRAPEVCSIPGFLGREGLRGES